MRKERFTCDCEVIHEEVVARVREKMPAEDNFYKLANFHKLLADKTRVRILWALSRESMCVCDLAVLLGMTKSAISHQLKSLRLANHVKYDKQGREVYYTLSNNSVRDVFNEEFEPKRACQRRSLKIKYRRTIPCHMPIPRSTNTVHVTVPHAQPNT